MSMMRWWRIPVPPIWSLIVGSLVIALGYGFAGLLGSSDVLPQDIGIVLAYAHSSDPEGFFIQCGLVTTGAVGGYQVGLLTLLFGGPVAAIVAKGFARRGSNPSKRWTAGWSDVFLAGLVFQIGNLILAAFLLLLFLWMAFESGSELPGLRGIAPVAGPLLLIIVCSVWGLRSWRALQANVERPYTISGVKVA